MPMDDPVEDLSPARYQQLLKERERLRGMNGFKSAAEALESLAAIIGEEDLEEFSATIRRWRGYQDGG